MKAYIDKSRVDELVQLGWSGDSIVTAIANGGISPVLAIQLDRIQKARAEIEAYCENATDVNQKIAFNACLMVIDNLIAEAEVD